ncbi:MAG: Type 1 glutamine amidotransferase-like domain-containing protein [Thermoanaerobaculaceae bacterium]|jgi:peptidase E
MVGDGRDRHAVGEAPVNGTPKPVYLIGGGDRSARKGPDPLLEAVLAQDGKLRPSIAYVGVASDDDRGFFRWLVALFQHAGSGDVRMVRLASPRADIAEARALLERSDIVFISGGDVEAGMAHLDRHGLSPFLKELHRAGKPFFGVSAGSIMLARCWVRWRDPHDDASAEEFPCMGIAPVMCDTHAESDDWEELRALLGLTANEVGYGIAAGGALRVDADRSVRALGKPVQRFASRSGAVEKLHELMPL